MWFKGCIIAVKIPRWYGFHRQDAQDLQLHVFCDASEIAYGAVAYLRAVVNWLIAVCFVVSKTRLAPIKAITIPRLELQAAVVAVRLKCKILDEIDTEVGSVHLWSDSKIAIQNINNTTKRFSTYVSHRVAEILTKFKPEQWRHLPGKMNVADDCTRGLEIQDISTSSRWLNGPEFLRLSEETWPSENVPVANENELEIKASVLSVATTPCKEVVDWTRYSTLHRILRIYGWWTRFKYKLKCRQQGSEPSSHRLSKTLSADDQEKRWGCLFTCMTTRAVHLELAGDLSTDAFIMAFRRFRARRGNPKTMTSDNRTNFVGANRELSNALDKLHQDTIANTLAQEDVL